MNIKASPLMAPIAKVGGAFAIGMIARQFAGARTGNLVMAGALTVTAYNVLKGFLKQTMPQIALGDYDYPNLEYVQAGQFQPDPLIGHVPDYETRVGPGIATYVDDYDMGDYVSDYAFENDMGEYVSEYA